MKSRYVLCALLVAVSLASVGAQAPAGRAPVAVEFFASGPDGVVFDLRPADVTLRVDGRPREIRTLRFVRLPDPDPSAPRGAVTESEPPYGSNVVESAGRWVTIVIDRESIRAGAEKHAMSAIARLVSSLGPKDQVMVVKAPKGGVEIEFTNDHERVVNALRRFVGSALRQESEQDRSCRTRWMLNAVRDVLDSVTPLQGPKLVVVASSGLLTPRRDNPANRAPGPCEIALDDYQQVSVAAARAGAHIFVVQPDDVLFESTGSGAGRFATAEQDRAGLESLAGAVSGELLRVNSPDDESLRTVARATSGYYVATFEPDAAERTGLPRRLQVAVQREGVRVRARPDVVVPREEKGAAPKSAEEMLRDRVLYRALPLRVATSTSLGAGDKVNVVTVLESPERGAKLVSAVFGLFDARGRAVGKWTANASQLAGQPIVTAGEVAPGAYRLRVAAVDATGRQGSVEHDILARLTESPPLRLSGLVLGTAYDGRFVPKLVFGADQSAAAIVEVYGAAEGLSARFDLIAPAEERVIETTPAAVNGTGERRTVSGTLRVNALPPGDYVVRAIVSVAGRPVGEVTRVLRKSPSGF
jgi:VWFA-related protein